MTYSTLVLIFYLFPSTPIPKYIPMKTFTSISYWIKASTKSIDLLVSACILSIPNIELKLL